eukprot:jgi/Mesvir1/12376/Mv00556-RA.1
MLALARPLGRRAWAAARRARTRSGVSTDTGATSPVLSSSEYQSQWASAMHSTPRFRGTNSIITDGRMLPLAGRGAVDMAHEGHGACLALSTSAGLPAGLKRSLVYPAALSTLAARPTLPVPGQVATLHSAAAAAPAGNQRPARMTVAACLKDLQEWAASAAVAGSSGSGRQQWTRKEVEALFSRLGSPASHAPIARLLEAAEAAQKGGLLFPSGWGLLVRGLAARGEIGLAWDHLKTALERGVFREEGAGAQVGKAVSDILGAMRDGRQWTESRAAATPALPRPRAKEGGKEEPSVLALVQHVRAASQGAMNVPLYTQAMDLCAKEGDTAAVRALMAMMKEDGLAIQLPQHNQLVLATAISQGMDAALAVVDQMRAGGISPDLASVSAALSACRTDEQVTRALALLDQFESDGSEPGARTYAALFRGCHAAANVDALLRVYGHLTAGIGGGQLSVQNKGKAPAGRQQALSDVSIYRPLVATLVDAGRGDELGEVLAAMLRRGVRPDGHVYRSMIRGLGLPGCRSAVTDTMATLRASLPPAPPAKHITREHEQLIRAASRRLEGGRGNKGGSWVAVGGVSLGHPLGQLALDMAREMPLLTHPPANVTGSVLDAVVSVCLSVGNLPQEGQGMADHALAAFERHAGAVTADAAIAALTSPPYNAWCRNSTRNRVATALAHGAAGGYGGAHTSQRAWASLARLQRLGPRAASPATLEAVMQAHVAIGRRREQGSWVGSVRQKEATMSAGAAATALWDPLLISLGVTSSGRSNVGAGAPGGLVAGEGARGASLPARDVGAVMPATAWAALVDAYSLQRDVARAEEVLAAASAALQGGAQAGGSSPSPLPAVVAAAAARLYAREGRAPDALRWLDGSLREPSSSSDSGSKSFELRTCAEVLEGFAVWAEDVADYGRGYPPRVGAESGAQDGSSGASTGAEGSSSGGAEVMVGKVQAQEQEGAEEAARVPASWHVRDTARDAEDARAVARAAWEVVDRWVVGRGLPPTEGCFASAVASCQVLARGGAAGGGQGEVDGAAGGAGGGEEDRSLLARAMGVEAEMRVAGLVPGPLTYAALVKVHAARPAGPSAGDVMDASLGATGASSGATPDGAQRALLYHRLMAQLVTDAGSSSAAGAALPLRGHDTREGALLDARSGVHAAVAAALMARGDLAGLRAHLQRVLDMAAAGEDQGALAARTRKVPAAQAQAQAQGQAQKQGNAGGGIPVQLLPLVRSACRRAGRTLDAEFAKELEGLVVR